MVSPTLSLFLLAASELVSAVDPSSILFTSGTIIAFDQEANDLNVIRNGSILIQQDRITGIWSNQETPPVSIPSNTTVVDAAGKIIAPGFVDTHRHGWQTLFKTMFSNITLIEYFGRFGEGASAGRVDAEQVYIGQLADLYEALNAGTTTSLDHAHHTWSDETSWAGLNASIDSGARVFWSYTFHDVANYTIEQQLVNYRDIVNAAPQTDTAVELGIAFDSFDNSSVDPETIASIIDLAKEVNTSVLTTHSGGGVYGNYNSPTTLQSLGILNTSIPVVFSHASYVTLRDTMLLRSTNQYVSITPESEMGFGLGRPTSNMIIDQAALGIDTHAFQSSDLVTQARVFLQTTRSAVTDQLFKKWQAPRSNPMSVVQAFLLATRHGGLALRRPDLGVLSVGAKADVVVWDGTSPSLLGWLDPVAAIILHSNVGDVEHVLVDGKFVKRDHRLVVGDYGSIKLRFLEASKRIQEDWRQIPHPKLDQYTPAGAPIVDPDQVDVMAGNGTGYGQLYV
ncbi:amidohydrolase [Ilyonectria robusta]|uniref:amidohydrolase n=1 Tax=Ilyonectria robusta TaxID=1079257 RepID=UPI001E8DB450|nr:amidohydrolase [Ilyonectria robusta]KAH8663174.1 amidohydrolase [Ilyonectria robusta]